MEANEHGSIPTPEHPIGDRAEPTDPTPDVPTSDVPTPDVPAPDGSTAHIRNPDGTPIDNPSG